MNKQQNPFQNIKYDSRDQENSYKWFRSQIKSLKNYGPDQLMNKSADLLRQKLYIGGLFLFFYDPKTKDKLPYYDTFPLVYPYSKTQDGFIGYNLHYLPPVLRFKVMGSLLNIQLSTDSDFKKTAKSYDMLSAAAASQYYTPCIKRYLNSHVRSKFLEVPSDSWLTASLLPLDRFHKKDAGTVWKDSLGK